MLFYIELSEETSLMWKHLIRNLNKVREEAMQITGGRTFRQRIKMCKKTIKWRYLTIQRKVATISVIRSK